MRWLSCISHHSFSRSEVGLERGGLVLVLPVVISCCYCMLHALRSRHRCWRPCCCSVVVRDVGFCCLRFFAPVSSGCCPQQEHTMRTHRPCEDTVLTRLSSLSVVWFSCFCVLRWVCWVCWGEQDTLAVMTDRLHKSGFKMHATLLRHMFQLIEAGHVTVELYDPAQHPGVTVSHES